VLAINARLRPGPTEEAKMSVPLLRLRYPGIIEEYDRSLGWIPPHLPFGNPNQVTIYYDEPFHGESVWNGAAKRHEYRPLEGTAIVS
jgi:hypothetical protein